MVREHQLPRVLEVEGPPDPREDVAGASRSRGRAIVRKYAGLVPTDTIDVADRASVEVSSEHELHPIDYVFDGRGGRGGSCWVAGRPGPQSILLRFYAPTDIENLTIESEEGVTCTQQIDVWGWSDDRQARFESPPRTLHYAPYGRSFHRETWDIVERGVTHVSVRIVPAPLVRLATLTSIAFR